MAATFRTRHSPMNEPSFAYFRRSLYALVCTFGLAVTAHAQSGLSAIQLAERAVLEAQQADADHYVPDLMQAAREGLIQVQAQAASRSRSEQRKAEALAARVAADADLARARSEQAKAEASVLQRRQEIEALREQLDRPATEAAE